MGFLVETAGKSQREVVGMGNVHGFVWKGEVVVHAMKDQNFGHQFNLPPVPA